MGHKPRPRLEGYWPMPTLAQYGDPRVSDGFGRTKRKGKGHLGVDIMYRRQQRGDWDRPTSSPWYTCPKDTTVHAMATGDVFAVDERPNGYAIKIDHGYPFVTVYRHVFDPCVEVGEAIVAGEPIGLVGYDERNPRPLRHLHFELWDYRRPGIKSRRNLSVDPGPYLRQLEYLR